MTNSPVGPGGRFARWRSGWGLALRMARRDVRRHWARSLLIVVMVGVPVAVISGGLAALASTQATRAKTLPSTLGTTQARLDLTDRRVEHDPYARALASRDAAEPIPGVAAGQAPTATDVQRLTGGRLIPIAQTIGRFSGALGTGWVLGVDGRDPATEGMVQLVQGRWPETPGEAVVTPYGLQHGLPREGELSYRIETEPTTVRVVGVAQGWGPGARPAMLVTLPETLGATRTGSEPTLGPWVGRAQNSWLLARDTPVDWPEVRRLNDYGLIVLSRQAIQNPPSAQELRGSMAQFTSDDVADGTVPVVVLGGVAILLVTTLLAGPAFAVSATRQRRTLALSAVNGAPGRQLRRVVLAQALVLGGLGAAVSAAAGVAAAWAVLAVLRARGADLPNVPLAVQPLAVLVVVLVATVSALIAAAIPARGLGRLDLVTALRGQAPAAAPRRRTPVIGLALVGAGTAVLLGCAIAMSRNAGGDAATYGAAAGAIVLVVGALFVLPSALVWIGDRAGGAPLPLRLAARDAARQRGRATPATAAVMATVAWVTAILIAGSSGAAKDEATYQPRAPMGAARIAMRPDTKDVTPVREEASRLAPGSTTVLIADPTQGPSLMRDDSPGTPQLRLAVLPSGCPVRAAFDSQYAAELAGNPPPGPDNEAPDLPCRPVGLSSGETLVLVDGDGVAALPGLSDDARRTLADGGILASKPSLVQDGRARLVTAQVTWHAVSTPTERPKPPTVTDPTDRALPARVVDRDELASLTGTGHTPRAVLTVQAAAAAGLTVAPNSAIVIGPAGAPLSQEQENRLLDALASHGMSGQVERGYQSPTALAYAIVLGITLFIVLVAALTSTALSLAEQQADLATLTAIGATRRTRRAMAAAQALVVAGLGTAVGMALGFVPGIAMTWPATATRYDPETYRVTAGDPTIVIPWLPLVALLVVVPAVAAALAAAGVRRTPPMMRRHA